MRRDVVSGTVGPRALVPVRTRLQSGLRARAMRGADVEAVMLVENRIYPFPWTAGNFADSIDSGYECWIFEDANGRLACYAVCMWITDEIHLLNLSVCAEDQGKGLGREVLGWLCEGARASAASGMLLEVRPSNAVALALYESSDFIRIGIRKRYYPAPGGAREDAWVFFRRFDASSGGDG